MLEASETWLEASETWFEASETWLEASETWLEASETWLEACQTQPEGGTDGRTDGRTDVRTKFPLLHRTSVPSGPLRGRCPKTCIDAILGADVFVPNPDGLVFAARNDLRVIFEKLDAQNPFRVTWNPFKRGGH